MATTVIVGEPMQKNPSVFPCEVDGRKVSVVVRPWALRVVPEEHRDTYVRARALHAVGNSETEGDTDAALAIVKPLAKGEPGAPGLGAAPARPDTRNWARRWVDGEIIS